MIKQNKDQSVGAGNVTWPAVTQVTCLVATRATWYETTRTTWLQNQVTTRETAVKTSQAAGFRKLRQPQGQRHICKADTSPFQNFSAKVTLSKNKGPILHHIVIITALSGKLKWEKITSPFKGCYENVLNEGVLVAASCRASK